jgi:NAD(P)-dependent dehydrogenase (short-subunit alcohol dehydrogenase family)
MNNHKLILVTGANKGLGFEIVRQLAKLGHALILTSRDEEKGHYAKAQLKSQNLEVNVVPLDISKEASIEAAFDQVKSTYGKLDVLINNAAILLKEDLSLLKNNPSTLLQTIDSNAYAQLYVTRKFLPIISRGGRIIMTSSNGGSMSKPVGGWSPDYCVSKSLLNAITRHLAYEFHDFGISVNAFDPGWVKTDMGGQSAPGSVEQGADTAVWLATNGSPTTGKMYHHRKEIQW